MNNFDIILEIIGNYLENFDADTDKLSNLHEVSKNESGSMPIYYVYDSSNELNIINMDHVANCGYKKAKGVMGSPDNINTVDAFIIDCNDEWYFLEFKDSEISGGKDGLKNNVLKKAYSNLYMLLDILYYMNKYGMEYPSFTYEQPIEFVKQHINYILVCNSEKNAITYSRVKDKSLTGEHYTPEFMQRLKDYIFKDAYVYTEDYLEKLFVEKFRY